MSDMLKSSPKADPFDLDTTTVRSRKQRYTVTDKAAPTAEGGRVGLGFDPNREKYLVHTDIPHRATEAVAWGAFATAIVHAIPMANVVKLFLRDGLGERLAECLVEHDETLASYFTAPAPAPEVKEEVAEKPAATKK